MKTLLFAAIFILMLLGVSGSSQAQLGYPCEFDPPQSYNSPRTHRYLNVYFHETNQTLAVIDAQTRQIYHTLGTDVRGFSLVGWSPSCRYIAGNIIDSQGSFFALWDAETGSQILRIDRRGSSLRWSPDEQYLLAHTSNDNRRRAEMLIDILNAHYTLLPWARWPAWDVNNNRVYVIHYRERAAVHAYELSTGEHLATYAPDNPAERIYTDGLFLSDDHSHIVYYTRYTDAYHHDGSLDTDFDGCAGGIAVYNVTSGSGQIIYTGCEDLGSGSRDYRLRLALSPDNRYVAVGRSIIRLWDLQALNPDYQANWYFEGPLYPVNYLRFLDNQTLETFATQEYRYALRWNFFSGDYLNTFDYQANVEVNRDGSPITD